MGRMFGLFADNRPSCNQRVCDVQERGQALYTRLMAALDREHEIATPVKPVRLIKDSDFRRG